MTAVVSLWIASAQDDAWAEAQSHLLDAQERAHLASLSPHHRTAKHYLLARVLRRVALQHETGVAGEVFGFVPERSGKPQATWPGYGGAPLGISLSHNPDYVVVATGPVTHLGVDVESSDRLRASPYRVQRLMARVFTAEENQRITAVPPAVRSCAVMQQWALKEAACKALGTGLRGPWRTMAPHVALGPLHRGEQRRSARACVLPSEWQSICCEPLWCVLSCPPAEFTCVPPPVIALGACLTTAPEVLWRRPLNLR